MPGNRIGRISEEVQRELSALIPRLKDPRVSAAGMVSVTRAEVTADLRYCKVYVSVLDKSRERDVLRGLKSASGFLRRELGQALRLRYTPELQFEGDDSIAAGRGCWKSCAAWSTPIRMTSRKAEAMPQTKRTRKRRTQGT